MRPEQIPPPIPQKKGPSPIPGKEGPPPIPKSKVEKLGNLIDAEKERFDEEALEIDVADFSERKDVGIEALNPAVAKMHEWQMEDEGVAGTVEMGSDIGVSFDMRLDRDKRKRGTDGAAGEDMFLVDKTTSIAGVFDGLGGEGKEGAGAKASAVAAQEFTTAYALASVEAAGAGERVLNDYLEGRFSREHESAREELKEQFRNLPKDVQAEAIAMRMAVKEINSKVQETGGKTTATLGKTLEAKDGRHYEVITNIGDGGAFKLRADGSVENLTTEDSAVNYLLEKGIITPEQAADPNYEIKKGQTVRQLRHVNTRALGMEDSPDLSFEPQVVVTEFAPGDSIVYLTDGLRDLDIFRTDEAFDPAKMAEYIKKNGGAENLASILNDAAISHESDLKGEKKKAKMDEKTVLIKSRDKNSVDKADLAKTQRFKKVTPGTPPPIPQAAMKKKKGFFSRILGKK